jgi:hypothetical protein
VKHWDRLRGGSDPEDRDHGDTPSEARRLADAILARRRGHDRSGIAAVYSPLPDDHDEMVSRQTTDKEWNEQ